MSADRFSIAICWLLAAGLAAWLIFPAGRRITAEAIREALIPPLRWITGRSGPDYLRIRQLERAEERQRLWSELLDLNLELITRRAELAELDRALFRRRLDLENLQAPAGRADTGSAEPLHVTDGTAEGAR